MRPSFTITVTHDERSLAGVHFHIKAKGSEQFSGVTDEKGILHITTLPPGLYWLDGDFLGTGVVSSCFYVADNPSGKAEAKLKYT